MNVGDGTWLKSWGMDKKELLKRFGALLMVAALIGIDRLTKWLVTSNMELKETISVIKFGETEVLNISYCTNTGVAFSKFQGMTKMLIAVTSVLLVVLIALLFFKSMKMPAVISLGLIIGGGAGNLIDRIFNDGKVIDFIDFRLINFAIFNFADMCAVCGTFLLMLTIVIGEIREKRAMKVNSEAKGDTEDGEDRT